VRLDRVDAELRRKEDAAKRSELTPVFDRGKVDQGTLARLLEILIDASKAEQDRESNLNTRAAVVATVAGLIVAVSGGVAKSVFEPKGWTDWTRWATTGLFVAALFVVAVAMVIAVFCVLRPAPGAHTSGKDEDRCPPGTKNFLGETLVELRRLGFQDKLLEADRDRLDLMFVDRCLRTLPEWHFRNRLKARWLRRSWVFLAVGIVLIAGAAFFLLAHLVGATGSLTEDPSTELPLWFLLAVVAGCALLSFAAIHWDWVRAGGRETMAESKLLEDEIEELVGFLPNSPLPRSQRGDGRLRAG
jgi:hypothetical protein